MNRRSGSRFVGEKPLATPDDNGGMTRVCLLGEDQVDLAVDLLSYETAREALSSYDLQEPFENSVAVDTISLGAAVSLLNDLHWFIVRLVNDAFVLDPSLSESEWISHQLARAIRDEEIDPGNTSEYLKIYGRLERESDPPALVEPMYVRRIDGDVPSYDLRDVEETVVVRVTESEFEA